MIETHLKLYEISEELQELDYIMEIQEGELTPQQIEQGEKLFAMLEKKAGGLVGYNQFLKDTSDKIKEKIAILQNYKKSVDKKRKSFGDYVRINMQRMKKEKIEADMAVISWRKLNDKMEIDEDKLPEVFFKEEITKKPDKLAIEEAIEKGYEVPSGVTLEPNHSIRFKYKGKK